MVTYGGLTTALADGPGFLATVPDDYHQLLRDGLSPQHARALHCARQMLYGPTHYRRYQQRVLAAARANNHGVGVLEVIAICCGRVKNQLQRWKLMLELARKRLSAAAMRREANRRIRELQPVVHRPRLRYSTHRDNTATMTLTADATTIADLRSQIRSVHDVRTLLKRGGLTQAQGHITIVVPLSKLTRVLEGRGDDVQLRMSNGAVISGAELFNRALRDHIKGVLFHPEKGPINAYRTRRTASDKQRIMATAEHPTCAWPGCRIPASECQVHHLKSWKNGGMTNPANLVTVCKYHNAINDDDRTGNQHGYLERHKGKIRWRRA